MKKVAILTFHWATNHGAILQSYASQKYLESKGFDVKIIDYYTKSEECNFKNFIRPTRPSNYKARAKRYAKEKNLKSFRKKYLKLTKRYFTNEQLIKDPPEADFLICGSDQIWNCYYILHGENKVTPVYFLNFGNPGVKKLSLSASFGCEEYPQNIEIIAKPFLQQFDAISVREASGKKIIEKMGIKSPYLTADPSSLLSKEDYLELCKDVPEEKGKTSLCVLRGQPEKAKSIINSYVSLFDNDINDINRVSLEQWLSSIRDSKFVITNSFHCIMMCLKLHTPFVAIKEYGRMQGMNDRLFTLLDFFGLQDRISVDDSALVEKHFSSLPDINWEEIDIKMDEYSQSLRNFLEEELN